MLKRREMQRNSIYVASEEVTGDEPDEWDGPVEGYLLKRSAHGKWQPRYFKISGRKGHYLTYSKTKGSETRQGIDMTCVGSSVEKYESNFGTDLTMRPALRVKGMSGEAVGDARELKVFELRMLVDAADENPNLDVWYNHIHVRRRLAPLAAAKHSAEANAAAKRINTKGLRLLSLARRGVVANKKNRNGIGSKRLFFRLEDYGVDQHINGHHGGAIILYPEKAQLLVPDQLNAASSPLSPSRRLSSVSGFTKHFPRPEPDSKYFWAIGDIKQLVVTKAKVAITGARAKEVANFQGKRGSARVVTTIVFDNPGVAEDWATEIRREMRQSQLLKRYADGDEEAGNELKRRRSEQDLANSEAMAQITGVPSPRTAAAVSARLQRIALSRTTSTTSSSSSSTAAPASAAAAAAAQDANAVSSSMVATVAQLKSELYDASLPQMLHCMVPRGADNGDQHWWYVDSIERDHFKEAIGAMVHAGIGSTTEAIRHLWCAIGRAGGVENGGGSGGEGATHIDLQSIVSALSVICSASEHGTITDIVWCAFEKGGADGDQLSMAQIKRYLHTIIVMKVCVCVRERERERERGSEGAKECDALMFLARSLLDCSVSHPPPFSPPSLS